MCDNITALEGGAIVLPQASTSRLPATPPARNASDYDLYNGISNLLFHNITNLAVTDKFDGNPL
jgi:hypothetical protein